MSEEQDTDKIVIIVTCGPSDPERTSLAFTMANAALTMDVEVKVILQAEGVLLARKGMAHHVRAPHMIPLEELMKSYFEQGGKLFVCTPCVKSRELAKEDLLEGTELIAAAFVIDESLRAKTVFTY